jgi:hypothetical protein
MRLLIANALVAFGTLELAQVPQTPTESKDMKQQTGESPNDLLSKEEQLKFIKNHEEYKAGVLRGQAQAEKQLELNEATFFTDDPDPNLFSESLQRDTGLYYTCIHGRAFADDELAGRIEGHNARILESIRINGPPKNSFKLWEKELFGLENYFENQIHSDKPIRLIVGGEGTTSPDKKQVVKLVNLVIDINGKPTQTTHLRVGNVDVRVSTVVNQLEIADLVWGPTGSNFAVLKYKAVDHVGMDYTAIDLRTPRRMRSEWKLDKKQIETPPTKKTTSPLPPVPKKFMLH